MKKKRSQKKSVIHQSTGNIFSDVGFPRPEADRLALLSALAIEVEKYIHEHHLTQMEAARRFSVTQPRISNLLNGKFHLFSIDTLIDMLLRVGIQVKLGIKKAA